MERLSTLDAEFLHMEDDDAPMHIAGACFFHGEPPSLDEVRALILAKIHLIPRYRQRVHTVPLELGRPYWADDPDFACSRHVHEVTIDAPGDDATFDELMGQLMSRRLPRTQALWECWLVHGLAPIRKKPRWALVFKVHHCMVDGVAGVQLLEVLLDIAPSREIVKPQPWHPEPAPSLAGSVVGSWAGLASDLTDVAKDVASAARHPREAARGAMELGLGGARLFGSLLRPAENTIERSIGPTRTWAHGRSSLRDIKSVGKTLGGTVNDVIMASISAGYRDLLLHRGEDPTRQVVRALVPVSVRREDGDGVADNRVSTLVCELAVDIEDPLERLSVMNNRMSELKSSHMAEFGELLTTLGNLAPPWIVGGVTRAAIRAEHRVPQGAINTVVTNVPGPQFPLYCLGDRMLGYYPYVGLSYGVNIVSAILSYDGEVFFGITGDAGTASDVTLVVAGAEAAVRELAELAKYPRKK